MTVREKTSTHFTLDGRSRPTKDRLARSLSPVLLLSSEAPSLVSSRESGAPSTTSHAVDTPPFDDDLSQRHAEMFPESPFECVLSNVIVCSRDVSSFLGEKGSEPNASRSIA